MDRPAASHMQSRPSTDRARALVLYPGQVVEEYLIPIDAMEGEEVETRLILNCEKETSPST